MKRYLALVALVGLTVAGCAPDAEETETEAAAEAPADPLTDLRNGYAQAMNADDVASLLALHTENAVYMPAAGIRVVGQEAIGESLTGLLEVASDVEIVGDASEVIGDWALERGHYTLTVTPEGAEALEQGGYYISVSRMQPDGSLKLAWLASNTDAPPAMPSPPDMAPAPAPAADLDETLEALRSAWQEQYNAGNAEGVAALYTEDAVAMFAEEAAVEGPVAIQASLEGTINELSPRIAITTEGIVRIGDWVVGRGTHTMSMTSPEGTEMSSAGFHLVVCKQDADGEWKIYWHIGNNYTPVVG
jgi:uncharacterized protein (TIGR02246 family)